MVHRVNGSDELKRKGLDEDEDDRTRRSAAVDGLGAPSAS